MLHNPKAAFYKAKCPQDTKSAAFESATDCATPRHWMPEIGLRLGSTPEPLARQS